MRVKIWTTNVPACGCHPIPSFRRPFYARVFRWHQSVNPHTWGYGFTNHTLLQYPSAGSCCNLILPDQVFIDQKYAYSFHIHNFEHLHQVLVRHIYQRGGLAAKANQPLASPPRLSALPSSSGKNSMGKLYYFQGEIQVRLLFPASVSSLISNHSELAYEWTSFNLSFILIMIERSDFHLSSFVDRRSIFVDSAVRFLPIFVS